MKGILGRVTEAFSLPHEEIAGLPAEIKPQRYNLRVKPILLL